MVDIIKFFEIYEHSIYFLLGLGVLVYAWRFYQAWQEARGSVFGLEAKTAKRRLNRAAVSLFILAVNIFVVFVLVTFIAPVMAPDIPQPLPLQAVEITATYLADPIAAATAEAIANIGATPTMLPTVDVNTDGCIEGSIQIISPAFGEIVRGVISINGTVSVVNFGNYRLDYSPSNSGLWQTIQAGNEKIIEGDLVADWDLSNIPPGEYVLQLVVRDNEGKALAPCRVTIMIANN